MAEKLTALHDLKQPGVETYAVGYRRGHEVPADVAEAWSLEEGVDYTTGDLDDAAPVATPVQRPTEAANRAEWEGWAIANGMSEQEAADAGMDDLMAAGAEAQGPGRPADSAKKAEWVTYVSGHPQATDDDKTWAAADSTTKADLQSWAPAEPGDTVAVAATQANQG